jgi:putative Mg2+ transporter-C (MgtC) family protein
VSADPTRVVSGVVTGVGFLGAGVIMKDGLSISGLTTAASIWAASAVGVLLGVGFYAAALLMALLCTLSMSMLQRLEAMLPGRSTLELCLTFSAAGPPKFEELAAQAESRGYRVLRDSLRISFADSQPMWRFCVVALDRARAASPDSLALDIAEAEGVAGFSIVPIRN